MELKLYSRFGTCHNGYYKDFDGITDMQSCLKQCLTEDDCFYVSFVEGKTCIGYKDTYCKLKIESNTNATPHMTYQKIEKGKRC